MDFNALCFLRCSALLTCFLTNVTCGVRTPTPAGHVTRPDAVSLRVTPVQTTTTGTTESLPFPTGHAGPTVHTCTDAAFHTGSFVGGVVLTLAMMLTVFLGYRLSCSRPEVRYSTIQEEHDAII
ncbi:porimin-like isoform X2 [Conger conger]|uniref:porimin-like isoform X2 n=1 Tax=Conger conger TaxID=82655 RepID=UPI002A5A1C81|nr:porimin-like isoform X2 [Conger conger]